MRRSTTIGKTVTQVYNGRQRGRCLALAEIPPRVASTVGHADEVWYRLAAVVIHPPEELALPLFYKEGCYLQRTFAKPRESLSRS